MIKIQNELETVSFRTTQYGNWCILLNGNTLMKYDSSSNAGFLLSFKSLAKAIKYAKKRGYIPKSFVLPSIHDNTSVTIKN